MPKFLANSVVLVSAFKREISGRIYLKLIKVETIRNEVGTVLDEEERREENFQFYVFDDF